MAEAGVPGYLTGWLAVFAPAGTPDDVVAKLNTKSNRILSSPDIRERLMQQGLTANRHSRPALRAGPAKSQNGPKSSRKRASNPSDPHRRGRFSEDAPRYRDGPCPL